MTTAEEKIKEIEDILDEIEWEYAPDQPTHEERDIIDRIREVIHE